MLSTQCVMYMKNFLWYNTNHIKFIAPVKKNIILLCVLALIAVGFWFSFFKLFPTTEVAPPIKIGILFKGNNFKQVADGFVQEFNETLPGNQKVEYILRDETGLDQKDFDASAQMLVDSGVHLILAIGVEPVHAAKKVTTLNRIPVILELGVNPVTQGFVQDFRKPGGNITGISWQVEELTGKRLEFFKMVDPRIKNITIFRRKNTKIMDIPLQYLEPVTKKLGVTITVREFQDLEDFKKEVLATTATNTDAIFYASDPFVQRNGEFVIAHALKEKIPVMFHDEYFVKLGATVSYGAKFSDAGRQGARLARKILIDKDSPADIPIEVVSRVDLAINLVSARAIGLAIPNNVLELAQLVVKE